MRGAFSLALFGLMVALALAETSVRLAVRWDPTLATRLQVLSDADSGIAPLRWAAHPFFPFVGAPRADFSGRYRIDGVEIEASAIHNSFGFRTHEFPLGPKGSNEVRVVALGGSTTWGAAAASAEETWPGHLERLLAERHPDRDVRVYNLGISGMTLAFSTVAAVLYAAPLAADLVVVYHGQNDIGPTYAANFRPDQAHHFRDLDPSFVFVGFRRSMPRVFFHSALALLATDELDDRLDVDRLLAQATQQSLPPRSPEDVAISRAVDYRRTIRAIARGRGGEAVFSTFQWRDGDDPTHRALNDGLRREYGARGWHWADVDAALPDHDPAVNYDECHLTGPARIKVAETFFATIERDGLVGPPREASVH